jgi:hypothetical protein
MNRRLLRMERDRLVRSAEYMECESLLLGMYVSAWTVVMLASTQVSPIMMVFCGVFGVRLADECLDLIYDQENLARRLCRSKAS